MYTLNTKKYKKASIFFGIIFLLIILFFPSVYNFLSFSRYYDVRIEAKMQSIPYVNEKDKKRQKNIYYYEVNGKEYQYTKDARYKSSEENTFPTKIIYCNSKNLSNCTVTNPIIFYLMISFTFITILGIWLFFLFITVREIRILRLMRQLEKNAILIKDHPYKLVNNSLIKFSAFDKAIVNYQLPSGKTMKLEGEIRMIYHPMSYEESPYDVNEKKIDLLIDKDNPKKYIMDCNINPIKESTKKKQILFQHSNLTTAKNSVINELEKIFRR